MKAREVHKRLTERNARKIRQVGSHQRWVCRDGRHKTTVVAKGEIPTGTLRRIEADMGGCEDFEAHWLK